MCSSGPANPGTLSFWCVVSFLFLFFLNDALNPLKQPIQTNRGRCNTDIDFLQHGSVDKNIKFSFSSTVIASHHERSSTLAWSVPLFLHHSSRRVSLLPSFPISSHFLSLSSLLHSSCLVRFSEQLQTVLVCFGREKSCIDLHSLPLPGYSVAVCINC